LTILLVFTFLNDDRGSFSILCIYLSFKNGFAFLHLKLKTLLIVACIFSSYHEHSAIVEVPPSLLTTAATPQRQEQRPPHHAPLSQSGGAVKLLPLAAPPKGRGVTANAATAANAATQPAGQPTPGQAHTPGTSEAGAPDSPTNKGAPVCGPSGSPGDDEGALFQAGLTEQKTILTESALAALWRCVPHPSASSSSSSASSASSSSSHLESRPNADAGDAGYHGQEHPGNDDGFDERAQEFPNLRVNHPFTQHVICVPMLTPL